MKQCNTFEDLQALGTEKIHERTHISRDKVDLVLTKSFAQIGRVQFMGYISILEREYDIDLSAIKEEYIQFCQSNPSVLAPKESVILRANSNTKPKWIATGAAVIIGLIAGGYYLQGTMSSEPNDDLLNLTTASVQVVETNETNITDMNETNQSTAIPVVKTETNQSAVQPIQPAMQQPALSSAVVGGQSTQIVPQFKVWYGMIDLSTGKKMQNITADPIIVDPTKTWLIVLGHGRVELSSTEGKKVLNDRNTVHFVCENGLFKQITQQEFIERNGGKNW